MQHRFMSVELHFIIAVIFRYATLDAEVNNTLSTMEIG
jgi:hypothetical protein